MSTGGIPMYQQQHNASGYSSLSYMIRVSVHNGRSFVGPAYELTELTHLDVPGWKVLQVPTPHPVFDYVMGDVLTTIVVELLAAPPQVGGGVRGARAREAGRRAGQHASQNAKAGGSAHAQPEP